MRWNNRPIPLFLLAAILSGPAIHAQAKGVCPLRANEQVKKIDIFDGKPEELATLAPDDHEKAPNIWTVADIYEHGRIVTVRCTYDSGFVFDLALKDKVNRCRASRSKSGAPHLVCK